jgi:hypothetical protein
MGRCMKYWASSTTVSPIEALTSHRGRDRRNALVKRPPLSPQVFDQQPDAGAQRLDPAKTESASSSVRRPGGATIPHSSNSARR